MTLEPRVVEFLSARRSLDFCDGCLAAALDARAEEVAVVTRRLNALPTFLRDTWRCSTCGRVTAVIRALRAGGHGGGAPVGPGPTASAASTRWRP